MTQVLEATNARGEFVYYTGRAGEGWVSSDVREAFGFTSVLGEARRDLFNGRSAMHGLTFELVPLRACKVL